MAFAALAAYAASHAAGSRAAQTAAGLALMHLVPGAYAAALLAAEWGAGEFLLAAAGFSYAGILALSTAIKLAGLEVTPWSYWTAAAAASLALGGVLERRRVPLRIAWPGRAQAGWAVAGAALVAAYVLAAHRFIPLSEDDFLTPDFHWRLARAPATVGGRVEFPPQAKRLGPRRWELGPGTYRVRVTGGRLLWLVRATREAALAFERQGKVVAALYFHPPFQLGRCPHNYPPNTQLADVKLPAAGPTEVVVEVQMPARGGALRIDDLTGLSREQVRNYVARRYAIWDIGDVREQLCLARNLRDHLLPFTYSYDGTVFDGGGYTIAHLPLRPYVGMAALVLLGDDMGSFLAVWLTQLWLIYLLTLALARPRGAWGALLAAAPALAYATLVRPNIEGACLRTASIVAVLGAAYWLFRAPGEGLSARARRLLLALFVALGLMTKVGLMSLPALLFAWGVSSPRAGRRVLLGFGLALGALLAAAGAAAVVGLAAGAWPRWWATLLGGSFVGKFSVLLSLTADAPPSQDFVRLGAEPWRAYLSAVRDYTWWTLLGSCFLPLAAFARRDRAAACLLAAGGAGYLIAAASDPSLIIPGVYCSHYFTRVAGVVNLLAAGGLRCLWLKPPRPRALLAWTAAAALALPLAAHEHTRQDRALEAHPWHGALYRAAVVDFLKREAERALAKGRTDLARNAASKMMLVDPSYLPTALVLANCDQAEGKWAAALKNYEQGLARPWEADSPEEFARNALNAAECCLRLKRRRRARFWLEKARATPGFERMGLAGRAAAVERALASH